jgi:hypothetical protein
VAEIPSVLWSLHTTSCRATSFMPFFMVHGSEAVLPTVIDYGSPRVQAYTEEGNQAVLEDVIDQLDETRRAPSRVPCRRPGPPTSSRQQGPTQAHTTLEGPFIVHEVLWPRTYKIRYEDGRVTSNAWNIEHLRPFYP